jgi:hypothetical protein
VIQTRSAGGPPAGAPRSGRSCHPVRAPTAPSLSRDCWVSRTQSTFGPHAIGTERFATVFSGLLLAQVAGAILRKQARVQNPDKDELRAAR